ncbi:MAG: DUF1501 domain-containing protein [Gemmataceae bacterium]
MEPLSRRRFLGGTVAGCTFLTALSHQLARGVAPPVRGRPQSLILLWLAGGPSQLETFDPHPGTDIAAGTKAIATSVKGIQIAEGLPRVAEQMHCMLLIRSMVSKEGDHERGTYNMKTGFRPDPTVIHPSIGAILCHELPEAGTDIPRHISILPNAWSGRGGYLGDQYDAFRTGDPLHPVPDTKSFTSDTRDAARIKALEVVEAAFARGRAKRVEATLHRDTLARARKLMSSEQLAAFDVTKEPAALRTEYGDTPFGRACLAARRLTERGVRCVEVTLDGWDTHANNHTLVANLNALLDPALAALIKDLRTRGTLDNTIVLVAGEFGRTPRLNPVAGRDHWPKGFSVALAGGNFRRGMVYGETDPAGKDEVKNPVPVANLFATLLHALGIDYDRVNQTKIGRTIPFSSGVAMEELLQS